jgi:alpha-L-rhamnosidase
MSNISEILNRPDEHIKYQQLYNNIRDAFQKEYFTPNGRIMSNTQTAYCLAFEFDLVPDSLKDKAITHLVSAVNQFGHITTGFLGTPLISFVLSENGYYNEAYKLLMRKEFPGWLYPVTKGATTIWERWDGIKPDGSFQDKGMNSFNHYAYGAIANWMYQVIGGIQINEHNSGFKTVVIEPHPGGGITWANTRYFSLNGEIISNWAQDKNTFNLDVTIPCNTSGIVRITASQGDKIFLNNKIIEEDRLTYKNEPGFMGYEIKINSGNYIFKCQN